MDKSINVGCEDRLAMDERHIYPRYMGFRPADGQVCDVNPPRFSWPFDPAIIPQGPLPIERRFRLRIGSTPDLRDPVVDVKQTPYNFYNALPVLKGARKWFWQVTYDAGTPYERESEVRGFELAPDAVAWDRTAIEQMVHGHPRIIFTPENLQDLRELQDKDLECGEIARQAIRLADETLKADWFVNFPETDADVGPFAFPFIYPEYAQLLTNMAFAYMLTGDEKYLAMKDRLLTMARYQPNGCSSPEGFPNGEKFCTKITEFMGVCFDWLYPILSEAERETIIHSLDWRIEHTLNEYSWRHEGEVRADGIAVAPASHPWENITWTLTGALAVAEHSEAARQFAELGLHYITGVGTGFGPDEGWNEGVSYSSWKFGSLMATSLYAAMMHPELHLERNPFYRGMGNFLLNLAPVGVLRPAWGDIAFQYRYYERGQHAYRRKLAYLTGDGRMLEAWREWKRVLATGEVKPLNLGEPAITEITDYPRPWIEYALKHFFAEPKAESRYPRTHLLPVAGWAMGYSERPEKLESFCKGVGFVFTCRPRGGYSHSHKSNGGFELFAYGKTIATGGGKKSNRDAVARSSQSHNTVLIDGIGQGEVRGSAELPNAGRIVAWKETPQMVYVCGDVRNAYTEHPNLARFYRHFLFVRDRYFVVFDDLALTSDAAVFSWLYHIQPDVPVAISGEAFDYAIDEVQVQVYHFGETGPLKVENMCGEKGYRNPITGEDLYSEVGAQMNALRKSKEDEIWDGAPLVHNNLWLSTEPRRDARFLAVIVPHREGENRPCVRKVAPNVVGVSLEEGVEDVIAFGKAWEGAFATVDYKAMRG